MHAVAHTMQCFVGARGSTRSCDALGLGARLCTIPKGPVIELMALAPIHAVVIRARGSLIHRKVARHSIYCVLSPIAK